MKLKISEIKIGERWRKRSLGNIDGLAISINKFGMFYPPIVRKTPEGWELVAGFRRVKANELLKREEIEVKTEENLSLLEAKEIELEENLQRQDLDWVEIVTAKKELDTLKKKLYGAAYISENGWGIADTAQALDESESLTKRDIRLARAIEVMPELAKAKTKTEAMKKLKTEKDKIARAELMKRVEARERVEGKKEESVRVICGDAMKVLREIEEGSVDLGIADPPFGVGLDSMAQACEVSISRYKDTEQAMFEKVRVVVREMSRILKPDSHFYMFFPIGINYPWFYNLLSENFGYVDPIPLAWNKGTGGYTVDQSYRYMPVYQPVFFCQKKWGSRKLQKGMKNVFEAEPVRQKQHIAEMPSELMEILIEQSSLPGDLIVDPFAGVGPVGVAAKRLKRRAILVEVSEDNCNLIKEKLMEV